MNVNSNNNLVYMLVRSNPDKKDSLHYGDNGLFSARILQEHLKKHRQEHTDLHVIDVERGLCSLVTASKFIDGE